MPQTLGSGATPQRAAHLKEALAEERLIGVLLKNPDYCHRVLEKIQPEDFMTDFNREIFRVVCERLTENRSVELIALSEQLSEEQMGKVAGIMADPVSSRATPKEAQDYIEVIPCRKEEKNAGGTSAAGPPAAGTVCGRFGGKEEVTLLYCGTQQAKRQRVLLRRIHNRIYPGL